MVAKKPKLTTRIVYNKGLASNSLFTFSIINNSNPDGDITKTNPERI